MTAAAAPATTATSAALTGDGLSPASREVTVFLRNSFTLAPARGAATARRRRRAGRRLLLLRRPVRGTARAAARLALGARARARRLRAGGSASAAAAAVAAAVRRGRARGGRARAGGRLRGPRAGALREAPRLVARELLDRDRLVVAAVLVAVAVVAVAVVLILVRGAELLVEVVDLGVVALLVVGVVVRLHDLAVLDHAAPGAGLHLLHLDERLVAVHVGAHGALDVAHAAGGLLDQRARLHVEGDLDPREPRGELVEAGHAGVRDALRDLPLDPVVGPLRDDLGLELLRLAPDLRGEPDRLVLVLGDVRDPVHELRPLLELGELVVGGLQLDGHVDRLLDRHPPALADARHVVLAPATAVVAATETRDQAARGLLRDAAGAAGLIDLAADGVLDLRADLVGRLRRHVRGAHPPVAERGDALLGQRGGGREAGAGGEALRARQTAAALLRLRRDVADVLHRFLECVTDRVSDGLAHILRHGRFPYLLEVVVALGVPCGEAGGNGGNSPGEVVQAHASDAGSHFTQETGFPRLSGL